MRVKASPREVGLAVNSVSDLGCVQKVLGSLLVQLLPTVHLLGYLGCVSLGIALFNFIYFVSHYIRVPGGTFIYFFASVFVGVCLFEALIRL